MDVKLIKAFLGSAGGILLAAALERFVVAAGGIQALALPEPFLGIPLRYAVLSIGGLELVVALICLFGRQTRLQAGCLAWLMTNCVLYRLGLFWMHLHPQATCVGSLTDPFQLSGGMTGALKNVIPFYLIGGSYLLGLWLCLPGNWRTVLLLAAQGRVGQRDAIAGWLKMPCPSCGGKIKFPAQNLGRQTPCPHCRKNTVLRKPGEKMRMSCFFCHEHIEFPAHALGTKIPCPHCRMDITLKDF